MVILYKAFHCLCSARVQPKGDTAGGVGGHSPEVPHLRDDAAGRGLRAGHERLQPVPEPDAVA